MKLIDKDVLTEKLWERRIKNRDFGGSPHSEYGHEDDEILSLINSLEVKEVDLDKAIDDYIYTHDGRKRLALELDWKYCNLTLKGGNKIIKFAKHFFELGLRSTITEEDCKLIWNIGDEIPNMPEEEFFKELLRRYKAKKGE